MKTKTMTKVALASLFFSVMTFLPVVAHASRTPGSVHTRSVTYHNRTPRAHIRGTHAHS